jgi:prepilin-type processing-associated H-X9-DG protein
VQAAREAARRAQCVNNMKQIGLGIHNYHTAHDCFPPGGLMTMNPNLTTNIFSWSAHAFLLGYMEQMAMYNAANFLITPIGGAGYGPQGGFMNSTVVGARLSVFLRASQPLPTWNYYFSSQMTTAPGNSYYASYGAGIEWLAAGATGGPPNGVFQHSGPRIGLRDIQDGASQTVAFGEWRVGSGNVAVVTPTADVVNIGSLPSGLTNRQTPAGGEQIPALLSYGFQAWIAKCAAGVANPTYRTQYSMVQGQVWAWGLPQNALGTMLVPPNSQYPSCCSETTSPDDDCAGMYNLASLHPGGANILMADGSVRFLKNSVAQQTVWALGSRANGEVLSADAY